MGLACRRGGPWVESAGAPRSPLRARPPAGANDARPRPRRAPRVLSGAPDRERGQATRDPAPGADSAPSASDSRLTLVVSLASPRPLPSRPTVLAAALGLVQRDVRRRQQRRGGHLEARHA